jgi:hypothetical protein
MTSPDGASPKRLTIDSPITIVLASVLLVALLFTFMRVVRPRIGSCPVESAYRVLTTKGDRVLAVELCGRAGKGGFGYVERLSLVDPMSGERVARVVLGGFPNYLGQAGSLWFLERQADLTARDPLTLEELASSDALRARYKALAPGIHGVTVDAATQSVNVTDNQGGTVPIDGREFAQAPVNAPAGTRTWRSNWTLSPDSTRTSLKAPGGRATGATFLGPKIVAERVDPPSAIVAASQSLDANSPLTVSRVAVDGSSLWSISLPGQSKQAWQFAFDSTVAILTSNGSQQQLTTIAVSDGHVVSRYDY